MSDIERFGFSTQPDEKALVVDLETGRIVDRPDIARRAADVWRDTIERAGGTISIDPDLEAQIRSIGEDATPEE